LPYETLIAKQATRWLHGIEDHKIKDILSSPASSDAPYIQQGILMDFLGRGGIFQGKMSHMKGKIQ